MIMRRIPEGQHGDIAAHLQVDLFIHRHLSS